MYRSKSRHAHFRKLVRPFLLSKSDANRAFLIQEFTQFEASWCQTMPRNVYNMPMRFVVQKLMWRVFGIPIVLVSDVMSARHESMWRIACENLGWVPEDHNILCH